MPNWRDKDYEERTSIAASFLGDGESATVRFLNDGHEEDTRNGQAVVFGLVAIDLPTEATDMNGDEMEEGEEYDLYTSSTRLLGALQNHADSLEGEEVEITATGAADSYSRSYSVRSA